MTDSTTVQNVHPSWFDWITVAALVLGPIFALLTQRVLDWLRNREATQKKIYFTLMSTRASWLSNEHVQALNSIDIVFASDKKIRELWKKCLDHLATDESATGWNETLMDLRVDLYQAIGNRLGYKYTTDYIKRGIYFPKYHGKVQENQNKMLEGFAKAVEHGKLKVEIIEPPTA
jgi:hypothetical protein